MNSPFAAHQMTVWPANLSSGVLLQPPLHPSAIVSALPEAVRDRMIERSAQLSRSVPLLPPLSRGLMVQPPSHASISVSVHRVTSIAVMPWFLHRFVSKRVEIDVLVAARGSLAAAPCV